MHMHLCQPIGRVRVRAVLQTDDANAGLDSDTYAQKIR
jgi:hypothetical protein